MAFRKLEEAIAAKRVRVAWITITVLDRRLITRFTPDNLECRRAVPGIGADEAFNVTVGRIGASGRRREG